MPSDPARTVTTDETTTIMGNLTGKKRGRAAAASADDADAVNVSTASAAAASQMAALLGLNGLAGLLSASVMTANSNA
ncbi:MAG: hypothetical protein SGARI_008260, partial [Bacillariaceae sp.]